MLRDWHGLNEEFANGVEVKHERKTALVRPGGGTVDAGSFRR
jgi:hypothetical protein